MTRIFGSIVMLWLLAVPAFGQEPAPAQPARPPTAAAQDGFVPVDAPVSGQDTIPAPRLVATAYGFIWVVLFGYVWSVRSRLARVEREMEAVSRRVSAEKR